MLEVLNLVEVGAPVQQPLRARPPPPALVAALERKAIGAAFLDVTTPEPLPADDPLWALDNAHVTMHLSGRAQDKMFQRSAQRFLDNLDRYLRGEPVAPVFDPQRGY